MREVQSALVSLVPARLFLISQPHINSPLPPKYSQSVGSPHEMSYPEAIGNDAKTNSSIDGSPTDRTFIDTV